MYLQKKYNITETRTVQVERVGGIFVIYKIRIGSTYDQVYLDRIQSIEDLIEIGLWIKSTL